ncbi:MAG: hypothetical protein GY765_37695, partial [bacterium]|nr:hypothetical protein [bacterium]
MKKVFTVVLLFFIILTFAQAKSVSDFSLKKMDGSAFTLSEHLGKKII